jgi:hypothetical protein
VSYRRPIAPSAIGTLVIALSGPLAARAQDRDPSFPPDSVVILASNVPPDYATILYQTVATLTQLPTTVYRSVVYDRRDHSSHVVDLSPHAVTVDFEALQDYDHETRYQRYGAFDSALHERVAAASDAEEIDVALWLRIPDHPHRRDQWVDDHALALWDSESRGRSPGGPRNPP